MESTTTANSLKQAITAYEVKIKTKFRPNRQFYEYVGINQKRFGDIVRNNGKMNVAELISLAKFFEIPVSDLLPKENADENHASLNR